MRLAPELFHPLRPNGVTGLQACEPFIQGECLIDLAGAPECERGAGKGFRVFRQLGENLSKGGEGLGEPVFVKGCPCQIEPCRGRPFKLGLVGFGAPLLGPRANQGAQAVELGCQLRAVFGASRSIRWPLGRLPGSNRNR